MNQSPTPPAPPTGAPPPMIQTVPAGPGKNTIAIVALAMAIVGFIFACIPGALIVGWVLLPVSFILAIVGVAQKGKKKAAAIAALIVSVVGTIVGFVVFLAVAVDAVSDSFEVADEADVSVIDEEPDPVEANDDTADSGATEDDEAMDVEPSGPEGTRADPFAFDTQFQNDKWSISLTNYYTDADAEVANANMFNDEPSDGTGWVVLEAEATYLGEDSATTLGLGFDWVGEDGTVIGTSDSLSAGLEPDFDRMAELYEGATEAGKIAFLIPNDTDGLIRIKPGLFADEAFFALPGE